MDDLSSPHSYQLIEHYRSDGSVPVSDPGVSSRTSASNANSPSWASTNSPRERQEEVEREHEAEVRRLLAIIRHQQDQIKRLQQSQQSLSQTTVSNTDLKSEADATVLPPETHVADLEPPKPPRPITVEDPFPWDFQPAWPVTRAQRMDELRRIAPFYKGSHQQANIAAAINWHAQFYPAEIVPADLVIFQRGQKVDKSDMRPGEAPWEEGCDDDYVDGNDSSRPVAVLGGPSNATGSAGYGHFDWSERGSHMYEV